MNLLFLLSWGIVAFGQPARSLPLSYLAATVGYALFFHAVARERRRFLAGALWFGSVTAVQLFWMTSTLYQGPYILLCYAAFILWLALQFGLLTKYFRNHIAIAGAWTLLEWSRLYVLCGFAFNPIGLALTTPYALQLASIGGILGLSFWVMYTNLLALRKRWLPFAAAALFPFALGLLAATYHAPRLAAAPKKRVTLVQTGLLPDEKHPFYDRLASYTPPIDQWEKLLQSLPKHPGTIVLPEAYLPYPVYAPLFPLPLTQQILAGYSLPPLTAPYATERGDKWYVSHAFWAQAIANHYNEEVIAGFDTEKHNAAFHFAPQRPNPERYDKQKLVPLAEYLPLEALASIVANHGIKGQFEHGKGAVVAKSGISTSICYEELFAHLMREGRKKGATIYANLTNDGWFAFSNLPLYHLDHARPRTVENGVPLIRASNTGGTAILDSLGRTVAQTKQCYAREYLTADVPLYTYKTPYTYWGDWFIVALSACAIIQCGLVRKKGAC